MAFLTTFRNHGRESAVLLTFISIACSNTVSNVPIETIEEPGVRTENSAYSDSVDVNEKEEQPHRNTIEVPPIPQNSEKQTATENVDSQVDVPEQKSDNHESQPTKIEAKRASEDIDNENDCRGFVKRVEKDDFSIRVILCDDRTKKFTFKHLVVDIKSNPRHPYVAVYTSSWHDHSPEPGDDTVFPDELFIVNVRRNKKYHFRFPESTELHYDLWSLEGDYVAFLRNGVEVVKSTNLDKYLKNYRGAYRRVNTNKNPSEHDPEDIIRVIGWKSNTVLIISNGCCGYIYKTEYDIEKDTYKRVGCAEGYCMFTRYNNLETHYRDIVIQGKTITKYDVSSQLKRYFQYIVKHCFTSYREADNRNVDGDFTLSFEVTNDGKVVNPAVTELKTATPSQDTPAFRNCLAKHLKGLSFSPSEKREIESVTVRVVEKKLHP